MQETTVDPVSAEVSGNLTRSLDSKTAWLVKT